MLADRLKGYAVERDFPLAKERSFVSLDKYFEKGNRLGTRILNIMKKWQQWLENLSAEEALWLIAIFVAAMLGTMVSGITLRWGLSNFGNHGVLAQLAVCILATAVYGGIAVAVFYVLLPESRLVFKRIFTGKK